MERLIEYIEARILSLQNVFESSFNEYEKTGALNAWVELEKLLRKIEEMK